MSFLDHIVQFSSVCKARYWGRSLSRNTCMQFFIFGLGFKHDRENDSSEWEGHHNTYDAKDQNVGLEDLLSQLPE